MSSPARRMRRAQARQIAKQISKQQAQPVQPPPPDPVVEQATRLAQHGVQLQKSMIWTPTDAR